MIDISTSDHLEMIKFWC